MADKYTLAKELKRKRDTEVMAGESLYDEGTSLPGLIDRILPGASQAMYKYSNPLTEFLMGSGPEPSTEESTMGFGPGAIGAITPKGIRTAYANRGPGMEALGKRIWESVKELPRSMRKDPDLIMTHPEYGALQERLASSLRARGKLKAGEEATPAAAVHFAKSGEQLKREVALPKDLTKHSALDPDFVLKHELTHDLQEQLMDRIKNENPELFKDLVQKVGKPKEGSAADRWWSEAEADAFPLQRLGSKGAYGPENYDIMKKLIDMDAERMEAGEKLHGRMLNRFYDRLREEQAVRDQMTRNSWEARQAQRATQLRNVQAEWEKMTKHLEAPAYTETQPKPGLKVRKPNVQVDKLPTE